MAISPLTANPPIPPGLKSPHPHTPWRVSPSLFSQISQQPSTDNYKKHELTSSSPEFAFVSNYFNHQKPTNRSIAKVYCIHNKSSANVFENHLQSIETEAQNTFCQPQWQNESLPYLREQVINRYKTITAPFTPFEIQYTQYRKQTFTHTKVLPLWHGSTAAKCDSICRSGFTFFGKHGFLGGGASADSTDVGFFGSGIYFTTSARYAADTYSDGEHLLLGWVSFREPFPVISDTPDPSQCTDMQRLKGQGAYHKYNAHYIPVVSDAKNPQSGNYYPCPLEIQPVWDELVVFQQSQTLVRFWVVMQVDLTKPVPGASLTVGALLKLVTANLDQQKVQSQTQLNSLLENKETELMALNPAQVLTQADTVFYNCMNHLFDENKNLRDRIVKKLLPPATPSTALPPVQPLVQSLAPSTATAYRSASSSNSIPALSTPLIPSFTTSAQPSSTTTLKLVQTLQGHTAGVWALTVLPDGIIASRSADNMIRLWDAATGACKQTLHGHTSPVCVLTILPEGTLASGSIDNTIRLWDVATGVCKRILQGHTASVNALTALPNGILASGSSDKTIRLWDVVTGVCKQTLHGHTASVNALTVLTDGTLASGSIDKTIKLWR